MSGMDTFYLDGYTITLDLNEGDLFTLIHCSNVVDNDALRDVHKIISVFCAKTMPIVICKYHATVFTDLAEQ